MTYVSTLSATPITVPTWCIEYSLIAPRRLQDKLQTSSSAFHSSNSTFQPHLQTNQASCELHIFTLGSLYLECPLPNLACKVPIVSPEPSSKVNSSLKPSLLPQVFSSHCSQQVSNFGCIRELLKYTVTHPFKYLTTCGHPELFQGRKSLCIFNYCQQCQKWHRRSMMNDWLHGTWHYLEEKRGNKQLAKFKNYLYI